MSRRYPELHPSGDTLKQVSVEWNSRHEGDDACAAVNWLQPMMDGFNAGATVHTHLSGVEASDETRISEPHVASVKVGKSCSKFLSDGQHFR
jgi:hypothetical protein